MRPPPAALAALAARRGRGRRGACCAATTGRRRPSPTRPAERPAGRTPTRRPSTSPRRARDDALGEQPRRCRTPSARSDRPRARPWPARRGPSTRSSCPTIRTQGYIVVYDLPDAARRRGRRRRPGGLPGHRAGPGPVRRSAPPRHPPVWARRSSSTRGSRTLAGRSATPRIQAALETRRGRDRRRPELSGAGVAVSRPSLTGSGASPAAQRRTGSRLILSVWVRGKSSSGPGPPAGDALVRPEARRWRP